MEANHFSRTAMGTAFMRAYHAAHDHPKVFDDFLAHRLIKEDEQRLIEERHIELFRRTNPVRAASCTDRASLLSAWMRTGAPPRP